MRFEEIFEDYTFEHWKEYYLDYKLLDKLIDQITLSNKASRSYLLDTNIIIRQSSFIESDAIGRTASIPTSNHEFEISEISEHKFRRKSLDDTDNITLTMTEPFLNKTQSISSKPLYMDEEEKELAKQTLPLFSNYKNFGQWNIVLKKQLDKLDAFYKRKLNDLLKFSELVLKTFDDIEVE